MSMFDLRAPRSLWDPTQIAQVFRHVPDSQSCGRGVDCGVQFTFSSGGHQLLQQGLYVETLSASHDCSG